MADVTDIKDPAFRSALEEAERLIDDGDYNDASKKMVETFIELVASHSELLPPAEVQEVQPLDPTGQPRIAEGVDGLKQPGGDAQVARQLVAGHRDDQRGRRAGQPAEGGVGQGPREPVRDAGVLRVPGAAGGERADGGVHSGLKAGAWLPHP